MRTLAMIFAAWAVWLGGGNLSLGSVNEYKSVLIRGVPHILQKPDFCGEACAAMWLNKLGHAADQDSVYDQSGLNPALGRGCYTREMMVALNRIGFSIGPVFKSVDAKRADAQLETAFSRMISDLHQGVPSIVCNHYDDSPGTTEHFRLVLGYDARTDSVIYHEPAERKGAYKHMQREQFKKLWPLKYDQDSWTLIRMTLAGEALQVADASKAKTGADFAQHVQALKKKMPAGDFTIIIQQPFVVIGDEKPATVRRRAEGTVKWASDKLKEAFFEHDPEEIIDVWLFADDESYEDNSEELFGEEPGTPFGYYSESHNALVMNISTGGGTLVHEIVHPYVKANFPACPAWFNEGLGSLYEQCGERDDKIVGFTNWRLAGLQRAIKAGKLPSFTKLTGTSSFEFYNKDPGSNYAQARYLCYYLQQKGLLRTYYAKFHAAQKDDPTGLKTLKEVLKVEDLEKFQQKWEKWVLKLSFP